MPKGSKYLPFREDPISEVGKLNSDRVTSHESVSVQLSLSMGKFSRRQIGDIFLFLFFKKIGFDISCKLSLKEMLEMSTCFLRILRKYFRMSSAENNYLAYFPGNRL